MEFYKDDFCAKNLKLHRDMFLNITKQRKVVINNLKDIVTFFKKNLEISELLDKNFQLIKILLTIPVTSYMTERSFSALRRLKTYSTMGQRRLNNITIMYVHCDITNKIDLNQIINKFINKNSIQFINICHCK